MAKKLYEVTVGVTYYCLAECEEEALEYQDQATDGMMDTTVRRIKYREPIRKGYKDYALFGDDGDDLYLGAEMKKLPKKTQKKTK